MSNRDRSPRVAVWLTLCSSLGLLAGCASEEPVDTTPVRMVVFAAPGIGAEDPQDGTLSEDLVWELVDLLSEDTHLDLCLVPGPLLDATDPAAWVEVAAAQLGSIAAPVLVGLGPSDVVDEPTLRDLLEQLSQALPAHHGKAAYFGPELRGIQAVALSPHGDAPDPEAPEAPTQPLAAERWVAVAGAQETRGGPFLLLVRTGSEISLTKLGGQATLILPPFTSAPHLYAIATFRPLDGHLTVELHSLDPDAVLPAAPAPLQVSEGVEE
jgi:hypothetical protein